MTTTTMRPGDYEARLQARLVEIRSARRPRAGTKSRRSTRRSRALAALLTTGLLTALVATVAIGVHDLNLFQLDGNVADDGAGDDWANVYANTDTAIASVFVNDAVNTDDNIFTGAQPGGSSKDIEDIPAWRHTIGSVPDKDDLEHAFAAAYLAPDSTFDTDTDPDLILYFGADRFANNGTAQMGFWFIQGGISENPGDPGTFDGVHEEGDVLILSDFTNGGSVPNIAVYRWVANCVGPNCVDDNLLQEFPTGANPDPPDCLDPNHPSPDEVCATVNNDEYISPWPYVFKFAKQGDPANQVPIGGLYEGGVNLSALGLDIGCGGSFLAETRASHTVDSVLKDYVLGSFELCPNLQLEKTPDTGNFFVGDSFGWTLTVTNSSMAMATNAVVTDTIPAGLTINSATFDVDPGSAGGMGSCTVVAQLVTCSLGTIAGSDGNTTGPEPDTAAIKVDVTATAGVFPGSEGCVTVDNTGSVSADGEDTNPANNSDGGSVTICRLSVGKTAATSLTRTFNWTINKTVTPESWALFDGETGTSRYTVAVDKVDFTDSNWAVTGNITISNPSTAAATLASVTDVISVGLNATVNCPSLTVPASGSLVCTYSRSLPDGTNRTNTATANQQNYDYSNGSPVAIGTTPYEGTAAVSFASPTVTSVNPTVHVSDPDLALPGEPVAFSDDGSVNVDKTFDCSSLTIADGGSGSYTFNNTAQIDETLQTDSASVGVTCYRLDVEKTTVESRTRTWNWTINKTVTPDSWALFDGETGTSRYTITVDKVDFTDSLFHVSGTITITNPHPTRAATINSVTDVITALGLTDVNATVSDCSGDTTAPYTVPAAGNVVCNYSADLDSGATRTNTATATQQLSTFDHLLVATADGTEPYTDQESVDFTGATTTEVNATIHVSDNNLALPGEPVAFSDDGSVTVDKAFNCDQLALADGASGSYTFNNTARIDETLQNDNASVGVTCYRLDVEKSTVETSTRRWTWTIEKSADQTALTLMIGETFNVNYSVTVNATSADSGWAVSGVITITNPHPTREATINSVTDVISALGLTDVNATVSDCDGDTTAPYTVPAADSVECDYSAVLDSGVSRTNTATATQQLYTFDHLLVATADGTENYSDQEPVTFGAPTTVTDECVTVFDTNLISLANPTGMLGTACAPADIPKTFTYTLTIGPIEEADCGEFDVDNTARFVTNDTQSSLNDTWSVHVTVPCPEGCTLTQGYWKTHNESFPGGAPPDPNWFLIGDVDGDLVSEGELEDFFDTGMTWFEVFWTSPAGRPYYQLAHQWMAAYLNALSIQDIGGTIPASIQTALNHGADLLDEYDGVPDPLKNPDLKGKNAKTIRADFVATAGILGAFNEGDIGPGHCDEDTTSSLTLTGAPVLLLPIGLLAPIAAWVRRRLR